MAEGEGDRRSRVILGDITNQIGDEEREEDSVKKSGVLLNGEEVFKRLRISPSSCNGGTPIVQHISCAETGSASGALSVPQNDGILDPGGMADDGIVKICGEAVDDCSKMGSLKEEGEVMEVVNENCPSVQDKVDEKQGDLDGEVTKISNYDVVENHDADHNLVLSQSGSVDCTILHESQESRVVGSDLPCAGSKHLDESIKSCSCSFCSKAALLLLDLHQHDIKVRASAIKKSHKEASILARSFRNKEVMEKSGYQRISSMEAHLMHQWSSLFQRTADVLEQESKELEASVGTLSELRNSCKRSRD